MVYNRILGAVVHTGRKTVKILIKCWEFTNGLLFSSFFKKRMRSVFHDFETTLAVWPRGCHCQSRSINLIATGWIVMEFCASILHFQRMKLLTDL